MKRLISFCLSFSLFMMQAQENISVTRFIKTDLVSYLPGFPFNTGKFNIEVEFPLNSRTTLALDAAYIYSYGPTNARGLIISHFNVAQQRTTGVLSGAEYRVFYGRQKIWQPLCLLVWPLVFQLNGTPQQYGGLYTSLHAAIQQTGSNITTNDAGMISEPYMLVRTVPAILARIGFQSVSPRRVVVDQSLGIGIQYPLVSAGAAYDTRFISYMYPSKVGGFYPMINYSLKVGIGF